MAWGLVPDQNMVPVSGHVLRVQAPWVGSVMADSREDSWAYVIPNRDSVVLGSVDTRGNWDTQVKEGDREAISRRCDKLCPGVKVILTTHTVQDIELCITGQCAGV